MQALEPGLQSFLQANAAPILLFIWVLVVWLAKRENARYLEVTQQIVNELYKLNDNMREANEHLADISNWPPGKKIGEDRPIQSPSIRVKKHTVPQDRIDSDDIV